MTLRFGLAGTGPWAHKTQGPGLVACPDTELVGVWGRDSAKTKELADTLGVAPFSDYSKLLDEVEAVAFALPPSVQVSMASEAAAAGKHLLLDKPVALTAADAQALAVAAQEVTSVVFFTDRFAPRSRAWFSAARLEGQWHGGWLRWFSALQDPNNPYGKSPWRHEHGALWDLGPHALSTMGAALGPIESVSAIGGERDLVTLTLHHAGGAMSTVMLTAFAPVGATGFEAGLFGESGINLMPPRPSGNAELFAIAASELVAAVGSGIAHEVDVRFGQRVTELLASAATQLG